MSKIEAAKQITKFVVGGSVGFSVANALSNNVTPATKIQSVERFVAGIAVGMMASEVTDRYTDQKIDEIVAWWNENVKKAHK
jgi:heme O synthase-like polyprenyltransferase